MRRLVLAMTEMEEQREFRLGWSVWRRAHQAVAKRCHATRRALLLQEASAFPLRSSITTISAAPAPMVAYLPDTEWENVRALLPPQKPPSGRPRRDHRTVLSGMLWVLGTGSSWRDLPEKEFGPWQTVYGRYRKWCKEGLWQQIVETLRS